MASRIHTNATTTTAGGIARKRRNGGETRTVVADKLDHLRPDRSQSLIVLLCGAASSHPLLATILSSYFSSRYFLDDLVTIFYTVMVHERNIRLHPHHEIDFIPRCCD